MAATEARGSMSTTLEAYSLRANEVPGARCSRSLKGCVSALRPALDVSDEVPLCEQQRKGLDHVDRILKLA